jgi:hypothetical protein
MGDKHGLAGLMLFPALWASAMQVAKGAPSKDQVEVNQWFTVPTSVVGRRIRVRYDRVKPLLISLMELNPAFQFTLSDDLKVLKFQYPAFVRYHDFVIARMGQGHHGDKGGAPAHNPKAHPKGIPKANPDGYPEGKPEGKPEGNHSIGYDRIGQDRIREDTPIIPSKAAEAPKPDCGVVVNKNDPAVTFLLADIEKFISPSPDEIEKTTMRKYLASLLKHYKADVIGAAIAAWAANYDSMAWATVRKHLAGLCKGKAGPSVWAEKASSLGKDIVEHNTRSARASIFEIDVPEAS